MSERELTEKEKEAIEKANREIREIDEGLMLMVKGSLVGMLVIIIYALLSGIGVIK